MADNRTLVHFLKQLKHSGLLARRRISLFRRAGRDVTLRARSALQPYRFDLNRYQDHAGFFPFDFFLHREAPVDITPQDVVPRVVYSCWMGDNAMSSDRRRAFEAFAKMNPDLDHVLVTPDNVADFLVPGHPLHPAFAHLSTNHKSDYLRCYLLHFHGGAYTDVKAPTANWHAAFAHVDQDHDVWVVGYPEPTSQIADTLHGPLGADLERHFSRLVGNGAFIVRGNTPLTAEWYAELLRRMDYHQRDLERVPAQDPFGRNAGYPITWVGLQGLVFLPLQLKHLEHICIDDRLTPSFERFR